MAQFPQSFRLNLTNTLTGNVELFSYLFQCAGTSIFQTKTKG